MILIIPVKNEAIALNPAISVGIERIRLSENFSLPRCPEAIRNIVNIKSKIKVKINQSDHLPELVFGSKCIFLLFFIVK